MTLLEGKGLKMVFGDGAGEVVALPGVDLMLSRGETVAVVGASGAGKSTLLHILGGLERPTSGEVWLEGQSLYDMPDAGRTRLRNTALGFVYQFHHLLPEFTAEENVAMPLLIRRPSNQKRHGDIFFSSKFRQKMMELIHESQCRVSKPCPPSIRHVI